MGSRTLWRGWLAVAVFGLLALVAAFAVYRLFDYRVFFDASNRLVEGRHLYPSRSAINAKTRDYYVYPPLVAWLTVPLGQLRFAVAGALYAAAMIGALVLALSMSVSRTFAAPSSSH